MLHYISDVLSREEEVDCKSAPTLVLGGYSYGSMITSHLPPTQVVIDLFKSPAADSPIAEIVRRAEDLAHDARACFEMRSAQTPPIASSSPGRRPRDPTRRPKPGVIMGGYSSETTSRRVSRESSRRSIDGERIRQSLDRVRRKMNPSSGTYSSVPSTEPPALQVPDATRMVLPDVTYLIVSPILSTVASFSTMFSKLRFTMKSSHPPQEEFHELVVQPCCCIYGSKDAFTSCRKLRQWTKDLTAQPGSRFTAIETAGGHFWHDRDGIMQLKTGIGDFLDGLES